MAFELAAINPTSVPINLLIPRAGTKFGERELMDPWEAVKWVAIFRLILPEALFRLCGGRVENLGELAGMAVRAGLNGVMMGNFLTALGATPAEDRATFEQHGPEHRPPARQRREPAARQPQRLARGRHARRERALRGGRQARRLAVGPLDAAALPPARARGGAVSDLAERLEELRDRGLYRRTRLVNGPQGPRVLLDGEPVLLLCSNNYLGFAEHPRVREAAADAALRWGVGAGASRLVSGTMTIHERLERALAEFEGSEACVLFGSGYLANVGVLGTLGTRRRDDLLRRAQPRLDHRRLPARALRDVRLRALRPRPPRLGPARSTAARRAVIVTESVFSMDGDVAPLAGIVELARRHDALVVVDEAHATGALGPGGRGAVAEAGLAGEVDVLVGTLSKALGAYGGYVCARSELVELVVNSARSLIFSTAPPPPAVAGAHAALELLLAQPLRPEKLQSAAATLRRELEAVGVPLPEGRTQIIPVIVGDADSAVRALRGAARTRRVRPGDPATDRPARNLAAAPERDGVAHRDPAARRGARAARRRRRGRRGPSRRRRSRRRCGSRARA